MHAIQHCSKASTGTGAGKLVVTEKALAFMFLITRCPDGAYDCIPCLISSTKLLYLPYRDVQVFYVFSKKKCFISSRVRTSLVHTTEWLASGRCCRFFIAMLLLFFLKKILYSTRVFSSLSTHIFFTNQQMPHTWFILIQCLSHVIFVFDEVSGGLGFEVGWDMVELSPS